ncbi:MAG: 50S ribosomal protein L21 [Parcubacteria group bacterium GW2011_GWF2_38_76]|nr:MAG: 50S ribosomal protein L21 [Parcubacteria group bacterium GW2011_GWF2_38_76]HBM45930.1 50S ribosomal protein L21 [Patescibacteria group bacterium]
MKFAVIQTGGKQYIVKPGDVIKVEKLTQDGTLVPEGGKIKFDEVLLVDDEGTTKIGTPFIEGASVSSVVVENGRGRKVITQKYKAKVRYRNKKGHRQPFTQVKIEDIK